ncbi:hypothetical protein [Haladaptatus litoreus]|uniref:hypothetical protein n=1 Tax=Haladaptatus litoreus TaxID=553468 RepID=UPI00158DDD83|nr:hypothetical protein [Haladaptatus litoreus]
MSEVEEVVEVVRIGKVGKVVELPIVTAKDNPAPNYSTVKTESETLRTNFQEQ